MLPLFILAGAAAAAGAAYLISRYLRRRKQSNQKSNKKSSNRSNRSNQEQEDREAENKSERTSLAQKLLKDLQNGKINKPSNSRGRENTPTLPREYEPISDLWKEICKIVSEVNFFHRLATIQKKVGEIAVNSNIPTGDIEIQQLQDLNDLPKSLPADLGAEDDIFYPLLATRQIKIQQPINYEGVYEEQNMMPKKIMLCLQDISGSTDGERIAWSKIMNFLLLDKAKKLNADISMTVFNAEVGGTSFGSSEKENSYDEVSNFINNMYSGGGTDINKILLYQLGKIEESNKKEEVKQDSQIVLITDGTEGVDVDHINKKLKDNKATLHTVILGQKNYQLKEVSDKFHYLDISQG